MNKCTGCGAILQNTDKEKEGFVANLEKSLCERCFRINNYNDYKSVIKDNNEFINILEEINKTKDLVLLVVDLFNISDISYITKYLKNDILLVLTKRDILPDVYEEKLKDYIEEDNFIDKVVISSKNNYNLDTLFEKINECKKTKDVYVVGFTNAGKSSLINKIIHSYSNLDIKITTSNLPSTTLNTIKIDIDETLSIIDTPGILENGSIINFIDTELLKKITPNKTIKPVTFQIRSKQYLFIDKLLRLEVFDNNITCYFSNNLEIERYYKNSDRLTQLEKHQISVLPFEDVVIKGLGFIKFTKKEVITLYTLKGVLVYKRKSLI